MASDQQDDTRTGQLTHGQVCYLQIPALDLQKSTDFYELIFGWKIERQGASFEAPGLIGQFVLDRKASSDHGPLIWINVDHLSDVLQRVGENGGDVMDPATPDGPRMLATIFDPALNLIGVVSH